MSKFTGNELEIKINPELEEEINGTILNEACVVINLRKNFDK
ncbi:979_t:CDS:2, partial [Funneliformis caledonium]